MNIVVTGSVAFDYIMAFPGYFKDHILPDKIEILSVSFLVDSMRKERGGCAANIAYSLALLAQKPTLMATVGKDFAEYRAWLEQHGVYTSETIAIAEEFTSSFFVTTDLANNQFASFYIGAMGCADRLSFRDLRTPADLTIISPNAPNAMVKYPRECKELGIPYIYDPSQQIIRLSGEQLLEAIGGAKILIVNDYEFEMIKNKTARDAATLCAMAETVIITKGEKGSTIITADAEIAIPAVPPEPLAEPTGVGDAYRAGVMTGLVHGFSWRVCGQLGSLAATYVLEQYGTQNHHYTLEEFVARYRKVFGEDEVNQLMNQANS